VDARDERGAAWMAAGYALATAEPGVVVVSNTPALTNAMTALADSNASGIPLLCITGGVGTDQRGRGHPGDADQAAIARSAVSWAARVEHANAAGSMTARGFKGAPTDGRPRRGGVSVLELPMDVQHAIADDAEVFHQTLKRFTPAPDQIAEVRRALSDAKRPVILAGEGCWWTGAGDALRDLVERARIPVFTVRAARGLISDDHELCFGFPNLMTPPAQLMFGEADVVLVLGARLDILLGNGAFHPGCTLIRVDADPEAFTLGRKAEIEICANPNDVVEALAEGAEPVAAEDWLRRLREAEDARRLEVAKRARINTQPLHPGRMIAEVARALPNDAAVCVDAGELALWAIDGIPARTPSSFHASSTSPLGALGMGLPWAIGMKVARPERPVLALVGDGSFGFTAIEIETSARHEAPVGVVVGNDGGWGIVRHLQQELHGRALASDLPRSPYELLAEFAGGVGDRVETSKQLEIAVANAVVAKVPSVVNVIIDPAARHQAINLIAAMFAAKR